MVLDYVELPMDVYICLTSLKDTNPLGNRPSELVLHATIGADKVLAPVNDSPHATVTVSVPVEAAVTVTIAAAAAVTIAAAAAVTVTSAAVRDTDDIDR